MQVRRQHGRELAKSSTGATTLLQQLTVECMLSFQCLTKPCSKDFSNYSGLVEIGHARMKLLTTFQTVSIVVVSLSEFAQLVQRPAVFQRICYHTGGSSGNSQGPVLDRGFVQGHAADFPAKLRKSIFDLGIEVDNSAQRKRMCIYIYVIALTRQPPLFQRGCAKCKVLP